MERDTWKLRHLTSRGEIDKDWDIPTPGERWAKFEASPLQGRGGQWLGYFHSKGEMDKDWDIPTPGERWTKYGTSPLQVRDWQNLGHPHSRGERTTFGTSPLKVRDGNVWVILKHCRLDADRTCTKGKTLSHNNFFLQIKISAKHYGSIQTMYTNTPNTHCLLTTTYFEWIWVFGLHSMVALMDLIKYQIVQAKYDPFSKGTLL